MGGKHIRVYLRPFPLVSAGCSFSLYNVLPTGHGMNGTPSPEMVEFVDCHILTGAPPYTQLHGSSSMVIRMDPPSSAVGFGDSCRGYIEFPTFSRSSMNL